MRFPQARGTMEDQFRYPRRATVMADHTYRVSEIVGSSGDSLEDAIRGGIRRASQTLRELDWFEVTEIRGHIENGDVGHFQVGMKVGFRLEEPE